MSSSLLNTYKRFPISLERAEACWLWDAEGNRYLDMMSGVAVCGLGHRHPEVQKAVAGQLEKLWHASNYFESALQEQLAQQLTELSFADRVFFCNSGLEANEAALKLARKATGRKKILSFDRSFHGRSHSLLSASGQRKIQEGFFPLGEDYYIHFPLNDRRSLDAVDSSLAAVIMEPVQGEGGLYPAEPDFVKALSDRCSEHGVLLIFDEIQTGMGRTGTLFGYEQLGVEPDMMTLAKGLGNGLPIGALLASESAGRYFQPGSHGSTFGGNCLALSAAAAVLGELQKPGFLQSVKEKGEWFFGQLEKRLPGLSAVKEIRGLGFMIGIELREPAEPYITRLWREERVVVISAGPNVIRLLPALVVGYDELELALQALSRVLS